MKAHRESDLILLDHIRLYVQRIREYTDNRWETFERSHLVQDAVVRNLQTLAESIQRLGAPLKATEPDIPWDEPAGFHNVLTHTYREIDAEVVWNVVERDLPELATAIERMIQRASNEES